MRYIGTYRYLSQISMWERGHLEKVTSKLRLKERIRVTQEFHKSYIRVSYSWRKSKWNKNKWRKKRKMESVPGRRKASVEIQRKWKNWYALKTKGYPHLTIPGNLIQIQRSLNSAYLLTSNKKGLRLRDLQMVKGNWLGFGLPSICLTSDTKHSWDGININEFDLAWLLLRLDSACVKT